MEKEIKKQEQKDGVLAIEFELIGKNKEKRTSKN